MSTGSLNRGQRVHRDGLREKLREFFREEVRAEVRAVAALNNVELITALILQPTARPRSLQLRILNGWFRSSLQRSTTRRSPHI
jgi:hypothetical protein